MQRWRFAALVVWAVGVQVHELIATVGLVALFVGSLPRIPSLRHELRQWWPLGAFLAWALLVTTLGGAMPDGTGLARTLDWLTLPFVAAAATELTEKQWRVLASAAFATLALSCVVAGLQYFGAWPAESVFQGLEWTRIPFYRVYEPIPDTSHFMGGGLLFHRLKFSHVSGLVLVAAVVVLPRVQRKGPLFALVGFGALAIWLFPHARMGAVAVAAGMVAAFVFGSASPRRALGLGAALLVAGVAVVLIVPSLRERFRAGFTDEGSGQRTQHLAAGLRAVSEHPIVGVGPGQFRPSKFGGPEMAEHVRDNPGKAHNQLVSMAAETGIVGALLFVGMLGWVLRRAKGKPLGALTAGALAHFAVLSLVHDPLFQAPFSMGVVLALGLGLAESVQGASSRQS